MRWSSAEGVQRGLGAGDGWLEEVVMAVLLGNEKCRIQNAEFRNAAQECTQGCGLVWSKPMTRWSKIVEILRGSALSPYRRKVVSPEKSLCLAHFDGQRLAPVVGLIEEHRCGSHFTSRATRRGSFTTTGSTSGWGKPRKSGMPP